MSCLIFESRARWSSQCRSSICRRLKVISKHIPLRYSIASAGSGRNSVFNRVAYSAAHVVAVSLADNDPWLDQDIDWDRTIAFRHYLWDLGLGVAEAMDTAQRGMGLNWTGAQELIRHSLTAAQSPQGCVDCLRRRN